MARSSKSSWLPQRVPQSLADADSVVVIGLGRFGRSLALELMKSGIEVLGIDAREDVVQALDGHLTHVVRADSTKDEALRQLGVPEYDRAVVGIGSHLESSILTTSLLLRYGGIEVWAKAISDEHGQILDQLGVPHVVYPEHDMGKRVAHLVRGSVQDYVEFEDGFAMVKTTPPARYVGTPIAQTDIRSRHRVTVVARRPQGRSWSYASTDTCLEADDTIIVAGQVKDAEAFSRMR